VYKKIVSLSYRWGFVSVFTLHCSLQAATGKMFVHAREKDNPSNMRYMGLLVGKYVPDLEAAKLDTWTGGFLVLKFIFFARISAPKRQVVPMKGLTPEPSSCQKPWRANHSKIELWLPHPSSPPLFSQHLYLKG
jgi:hypothetical protein